jgi:hypothetical protein
MERTARLRVERRQREWNGWKIKVEGKLFSQYSEAGKGWREEESGRWEEKR